MINFLKQLEGKHYIDNFDDECIITNVEVDDDDGCLYFCVRLIDEYENFSNLTFDQLWNDFQAWASHN